MVRVIEGLASDWHRLDERIEGLSNEIEELAKRYAGCERLMNICIGPIIFQRHGRRDRDSRQLLQGSRILLHG